MLGPVEAAARVLASAALFGRPLWAEAVQADGGGARAPRCLTGETQSSPGSQNPPGVRTLRHTGSEKTDKEDSNCHSLGQEESHVLSLRWNQRRLLEGAEGIDAGWEGVHPGTGQLGELGWIKYRR